MATARGVKKTSAMCRAEKNGQSSANGWRGVEKDHEKSKHLIFGAGSKLEAIAAGQNGRDAFWRPDFIDAIASIWF